MGFIKYESKKLVLTGICEQKEMHEKIRALLTEGTIIFKRMMSFSYGLNDNYKSIEVRFAICKESNDEAEIREAFGKIFPNQKPAKYEVPSGIYQVIKEPGQPD